MFTPLKSFKSLVLAMVLPLCTNAQLFSETLFVSSNTQPTVGVFDVTNRNIASMDEFMSVANDADGIYYDEDNDVLYQLNRTDNVINAYSNALRNLRNGQLPELTATSTSDFSNGREIAVSGDRLVVAQDANDSNSGNRLIVYSISAEEITLEKSFDVDFNLWGVHTFGETLFAVVDNSNQLAVFRNFFDNEGTSVTPDRIVEVAGLVRTHGLTFSAELNQMIMTDVGAASSATDGAIIIIPHFSQAMGDGVISMMEQRRIAGSNTFLGNPVDVAYVDRTAMIFVAERANGGGRVLGFRFPPTMNQAGNKAPVYNAEFAGASAVTVNNNEDEVEEDFTANKRVYLSSNTSGAVGVYSVLRNGATTLTSFPANGQDSDGIAYTDDGTLYQINRSQNIVVSYGSTDIALSSGLDPEIVTMSGTGFSVANFVNGRGLAVSDEDQIVVAQDATMGNGGNAFVVYGINDQTGKIDLEATYQTSINLWGVDLDGETLYAVVDNSNNVARFDNFFSNTGTGVSADAFASVFGLVRTHGITYVADRDLMLLTDIGSASNDSDGAIFIIYNYTQAASDRRITRDEYIRIKGSSTQLGNPVDLDYCPGDNRIYVAERATDGGRLLAFDLPMMNAMGGNIAPVISLPFAGASSVAVGANGMMNGGRGGSDLTESSSDMMLPATANDLLDWAIYPNPTVNDIQIRWEQALQSEKMTLRVIDINGQEVARQRVEAAVGLNTYDVNVAHLPTGIYRLVIENNEGYSTQTFMKQ